MDNECRMPLCWLISFLRFLYGSQLVNPGGGVEDWQSRNVQATAALSGSTTVRPLRPAKDPLFQTFDFGEAQGCCSSYWDYNRTSIGPSIDPSLLSAIAHIIRQYRTHHLSPYHQDHPWIFFFFLCYRHQPTSSTSAEI
jgi:hypothetical protein